MSVGVTGGILGSAAGAPLSQTKGSEVDRNAQEASSQQRAADSDKKATDAAGVGQTEEDQEISDRDADGRRLWEETAKKEDAETSEAANPEPPTQAKDAHGLAGTQLDLLG